MFKNETGKREILDLYDQKLASLNLVYETKQIETRYGMTNVIITGNASKPPLVLIHGSNGSAPIVLEAFPQVFEHYHVFAVDVLAQPNRSQAKDKAMNLKDNSFGEWMNLVLEELALEEVIMAGFSLGGLICLKTLLHDERRVKEVFLISPAYIVRTPVLKAMFKVFLPMRRYMKRKKLIYVEQIVDTLFTGKNEFAVNFLSKVFLHFEMDFTPVPVIKAGDAKRITTPINLFASGKDLLFPGQKMIKRANKIFPSLKRQLILEDSKHVQDREGMQRVEQYLLETK